MQRLTMCCACVAMFVATATAQDYDEDDPVPYNQTDRDYYEMGHAFGTPLYPRYERRYSAAARMYDNRNPRGLEYPPVDTRDRYARNYGPPEIDRLSGRPVMGPPGYGPRYDDPDPFDNPYGQPQNQHYIAPYESNFRGGRYATDYPGFRGGWYGRGHRVRIRAGEYTAGDYANAFWEHQHRVGSVPGEHNWNASTGQAY